MVFHFFFPWKSHKKATWFTNIHCVSTGTCLKRNMPSHSTFFFFKSYLASFILGVQSLPWTHFEGKIVLVMQVTFPWQSSFERPGNQVVEFFVIHSIFFFFLVYFSIPLLISIHFWSIKVLLCKLKKKNPLMTSYYVIIALSYDKIQ